MTIKQLREILNDIDPKYDDLDVWIDTDAWEGGKPVDVVEIKPAEECCLDGDEMLGDEYLYDDEICEKFGIDEVPDDTSIDFISILQTLEAEHYRYEGSADGEHRFSKKILAIKF